MKSKILLLTTALSGLFALQAAAQDETGELIKAGTENANILGKAYLDPFGKSLGVNLNNGWISTGKVFKPGRFEIKAVASASFIPDDETTFDLGVLGYNTTSGNVRLANNNDRIAPTVFGPDSDGPQLDIYGRRPDTNQDVKIASINTPPGIGYKISPLPMLQANVGLIKETELMVRYLPEVTYEDGRANMWGVGLKHSLRQWIPVVSALPFDITIAAGYTNLKVNYGLNVDPQTQTTDAATNQQRAVIQSGASYDNQELQLTTRAKYGSLVVSKTLAVITGYVGVSLSSAKTEFDALGNYPVTDIRSRTPTSSNLSTYEYYIRDIKDPIGITMNHDQVGVTAGLRLKLVILSINAEATYAKYPTASVGIGLGWN